MYKLSSDMKAGQRNDMEYERGKNSLQSSL